MLKHYNFDLKFASKFANLKFNNLFKTTFDNYFIFVQESEKDGIKTTAATDEESANPVAIDNQYVDDPVIGNP